ncbi:MAG: hypothetical protein ACOY93_00185 [Bacillota bacterium]
MARKSFKDWWTRIIPKSIERSTFVLQASLMTILLCWQCRPLPQVIWSVEHPSWFSLMLGGAHPYAEEMAPFRQELAGELSDVINFLERGMGTLSPAFRQRLMGDDLAALRASVAEDRSDLTPRIGRLAIPSLLFASTADPRSYGIQQSPRHHDGPNQREPSLHGAAPFSSEDEMRWSPQAFPGPTRGTPLLDDTFCAAKRCEDICRVEFGVNMRQRTVALDKASDIPSDRSTAPDPMVGVAPST